jgi:Trypsin-co-occurring domain 1
VANRAVKMRLADNSILIEVSPESGESLGEARVSRAGMVVTDVTKTFEDALSSIPNIANAIVAKMDCFTERPEEVSVEFSIKLNAAADVIIAKTSVEGAFKISVKWRGHK